MPKIVLTSSSVAYSLHTLLTNEGIGLPESGNARGLSIQVPAASFEAANAGATLKVGRPNAGLSDVTEPDVALLEGEQYTYPAGAFISLRSKYLKGSVNNQVLYVVVEAA
jgi:hypothetical protein